MQVVVAQRTLVLGTRPAAGAQAGDVGGRRQQQAGQQPRTDVCAVVGQPRAQPREVGARGLREHDQLRDGRQIVVERERYRLLSPRQLVERPLAHRRHRGLCALEQAREDAHAKVVARRPAAERLGPPSSRAAARTPRRSTPAGPPCRVTRPWARRRETRRAPARPDPRHAAERGGYAHRAGRVRAERRVDEACGDGRAATSARAAADVLWIPRVERGPEVRAGRRSAVRELVGVELSGDRGARCPQTRDALGILRGHAVQHLRRRRRRHAGDVDHVLDADHRPAVPGWGSRWRNALNGSSVTASPPREDAPRARRARAGCARGSRARPPGLHPRERHPARRPGRAGAPRLGRG